MSERLAFDYVLVQVVPRVDRDERFNAGVILHCAAAAFLGCRLALDQARARAFAPDLDVAGVARQLDAIRAVCAGDAAAGPVAALSPSERFHWLAAPRSTVVQPSVAHVGVCDDPETALDRIFAATVPRASSPTT
ncbi:MAG TPA: DUF3037 domain-containing protein [Polyangia bacterium]|nr:DUF3037 domain-containing protein [Polyangia bacterium]